MNFRLSIYLTNKDKWSGFKFYSGWIFCGHHYHNIGKYMEYFNVYFVAIIFMIFGCNRTTEMTQIQSMDQDQFLGSKHNFF